VSKYDYLRVLRKKITHIAADHAFCIPLDLLKRFFSATSNRFANYPFSDFSFKCLQLSVKYLKSFGLYCKSITHRKPPVSPYIEPAA
jgi:hypothetical protein